MRLYCLAQDSDTFFVVERGGPMVARIIRLILIITGISTFTYAADPRHQRAADTQAAAAQQEGDVKPPPPGVQQHPTDKLSVTDGQVTVDGQPLKYKATAGTLVMKDESDKPRASFFFVAYEKQPPSED